jgi:hypothetical protein
MVRPEQVLVVQKQREPAKTLQDVKVLQVKARVVQQGIEPGHSLLAVGFLSGGSPQSQGGFAQGD